MKHPLLPILILLFPFIHIYGENVDELTAKKIATSFITSIANNSQLKSGINLEMVYKEAVPLTLKSASGVSSTPDNYFYVFSSSKLNCFAIVSGDNRALPILGYSNSNTFDPGNIPPNMKAMLNEYERDIRFACENNIEVLAGTLEKWDKLLNGNKSTTMAVAPMLSTKWNQVSPYNSMCPYDATSGENALAGCGAVAMAQILRYWNYPDKGTGSNSYSAIKNPDFGVISADFENAQYDWTSMPNKITTTNDEVARILFHCGASINTDYEISENGGSDARAFYFNHPSTLIAFRKYFGYKHTNKYLAKSFYNTDAEWLDVIKAELDASRPVFYGADDESLGGHNFVCDGYDSNNYLHFNWGWGGVSDGFFPTEAIDLGYRDYTSDQDAIIGIEPLTTNPGTNIQFNEKISVSPSVYLKTGQAFSVTTDFKNFGAETYQGYFSADVYNSSGQWVGNINSSASYTLANGENTGTLTFSSNGISSLSQGTYFIAFWCIASENKLIESSLGENGYYQMFKKIIVTNSDNPLTADVYENNNTENASYEFTSELVNKSFTQDIEANIHNTSDIDYFKIKVPEGYNYTVQATLVEDCQAAFGFGIYPADCKISFKTEDGLWSDPEDLYANINCIDDEGYLYFRIEPAAEGNMGAYNASITVIQGDLLTSSGLILVNNAVKIYPSPNNGSFTLKIGNEYMGKNDVTIFNIYGKTIHKLQIENPSEISENISLDTPNGIYLVKVRNGNSSTIQKIIVKR